MQLSDEGTLVNGLLSKTTSMLTVVCSTWNINTATLPVRDNVYWLQILWRIIFKICTIIYKCIHGTSSSYLAKMCTPVAASTGRHNLHSATHGDPLVPRTRMTTYGPRCFAVFELCVWNDLSPTLHVLPGTLGHDFTLSWLFRPLEQHDANLLTYLRKVSLLTPFHSSYIHFCISHCLHCVLTVD